MTVLATYLLKAVICSGIFYFYYHLALRNKIFHQWNRFYLLGAVVLSLLLPMVRFEISHEQESMGNAIQLLQVVQSADQLMEEPVLSAPGKTQTVNWLLTGSVCISIILLISFVSTLFRIYRIMRQHQPQIIRSIRLFPTRVPGTPFSFLRNIFWNEAIDLESGYGQQIFRHELVHVEERHSWDKIFMQLVLILFWFNPFLWLIRRELRMVHEFIADKKAMQGEAPGSFAGMILNTLYPQHFHSLINPFFQTSIKRRIRMLSKMQHPRFRYISRMMALPILALTVFAFTVRTKDVLKPLGKTFTVVIDAGHGQVNGKFSGARGQDIYEDQIVLALAKRIKELNQDPGLNIVFSRTGDEHVGLQQRVEIARASGAQLFLSLHTGAQPESASTGQTASGSNGKGFEIYVSGKEATPFQKQNEMFGSVLQQELSSLYTVNNKLLKAATNIFVLNKNVCPAVILECGFITNNFDRDYMTRPENQEKVAQKLLSAIHRYASMELAEKAQQEALKPGKSVKQPQDAFRIFVPDRFGSYQFMDPRKKC